MPGAGGASPELGARAYLTILHYTIGFATLEQGLGFITSETRRETRKLFESLPEEEFPGTRALASHLTQGRLEQEYELGLQAIVAGLQAIAAQYEAA